MTIYDLRAVLQDHTTIWLQEWETEKFIFANELRFLSHQFDDCIITLMYPEKYPSISSFGITVYIDESGVKRNEM